jgi:hypothetical protein
MLVISESFQIDQNGALSLQLTYGGRTVYADVFCFLSSLPLIPPATTAVFGSYQSSLYS